MSVLVGKETRVLTQGITGATGQLHTRLCKEYGTQMVAGVTPGRGGTDFEGIPIFDTVAEAMKRTGANASVIYVPPPGAADAILEAADAGIPLVVCITEGVVQAARDVSLKVPLIVRMEGTNVERGKQILAESKLDIIAAVDMLDGAKKAVAAAARAS